ncbi:flagellar hook-length control protein FliK [Marinobacterium stanieri]|uniref:Hook-length control protein FliK n=1 Tax=Marinobacterium stanieri TaxID=49186 RepID=A0A1N6WY03_9GAMM|nr:flagellar hook-length control protein FliK [Marinobacterium stanieri]SIQ94972.1 hook-length control protein FliK [Marinobacterium stanieri]
MAIVKAPSQTSPSLLDLSSMQTPVNGMAAGAQGAAPGSFQLLFQGSLQAQGKVAANGQTLPAEGENLPGRLPVDSAEADTEDGAAAADVQTGQQDAGNLNGMPPQAGTAQASVQGAAGQAQTTDTKPTSTVSGQVQSAQLPAGQQPPQESRPVQQSTQATNAASGAAGVNGNAPEQSALNQQQLAAQTQAGQQALTQVEQQAQAQQTAEQQAMQTQQQAQQRTKQQAQQSAQQKQAGQQELTESQLRNQAQQDARQATQQQTAAKAQSLMAETQTQQPGISPEDQGRENRTQLPASAAEQARVEAQARVAANGAVDNASAQPHPLSGTANAETAQGGQAGTLEGDAKVPVSAGQTSASATPASQTAANGAATAQAGAEAAPDPVTILASQDAVQAKQTQQGSGENRAPTQLVAPSVPADNASARQAQLDPAQVRGAEAGGRVDVSALNTGGGGAGGMGSESGDSGSQRQDSGTQSGTTQNTQAAQPRNPQAAQAQAQQLFNAHPQLLTPRWGQAVGERMIMMAQHGPRSAQIQLDPPELGSMQIRVHVQGQDQISVSFTSPNPAVRDALEQQMPRLREMLAEQGLELSEGAISDDSSSNGQGSDSRGGSEGRTGGYAGGGTGELDSESLPGSAVAVGLVDYYA